MTFLNRTLFAPALLGVLTLTACDATDTVDPGPQTANVTLDILSVRAAGSCDGDSPAEYQIQVGALDAGNNVITSETLPRGTADYGVWPGTDAAMYVQLTPGQTATLDTNLLFQRTLDASGNFSIFASAIEWDANGAMDPRMSDVTETRSHAYTSGQFADISGTKSIRVREDAACDLTIQYRVSVQ